jgi:hypothetical protein
MKKTIFTISFILICQLTFAQTLGNEWIKPNQIYYKIKIWEKGIYKIDSNQLAQIGINLLGINPSKFQIFRNGIEQACFIQGESDGEFNFNDYISFYGAKNDGLLDAELYNTLADQPHQFNSLFSDTAVYFLTVIPNSSSLIGKRFTVNNETNYNLYIPEAFYIHQIDTAPIQEYYRGKFESVGVGEFYYLSEYLEGEGWLSEKFGLNENKVYSINTPNLYLSGPVPTLEAKVFGVSNDKNKVINHHLKIGISNNNLSFSNIKDTTYSGYTETKYLINLNNSTIGNSTFIKFETVADLGVSSDFSSLSYFSLKYASTCNINNQSQLHFKHIAQLQNANKIYFKFNNYGKNNPQLLDLTNNKKINCTKTGSDFNALVNNTNQSSELYIYDETDIKNVTKLELVDMNYSSLNLNTEFIIITNKKLETAANAYKNYRLQKFTTSVFYSNNLYNQFFYGYEHPLAVKHFLKYLYQNQTIKPKYLLLLGRGYQNNLIKSNFQSAYNNNLVPAIGEPSSDNMYTVGLNNSIPYAPAIATGRIPATTNEEALNYLNKLISYEKDTIFDTDWRKQILHISGGDINDQASLANQLNINKTQISNINFGANVTTFNKNSAEIVEVGFKDKLITELNKGKSLMTFFGHGSLSVLDVDFGKISDLQNVNKYTFFYFNGCNIGNANDADPLGSGNIYGKDYLMAPNKGAIGWLAHSNITLLGNLNVQMNHFYNNLSYDLYSKSIGEIIQQSIAESTLSGDVFSISHGNQLIYQGDPAMKLTSPSLPDYEITDANIFLTDKNLTALADSFEINIIVKNLGKANHDSISVSIEHLVSSTGKKIYYDRLILPSPLYKDTLTVKLKGQGKSMAGNNIFNVFVDHANAKYEMNENNNRAVYNKFIPGSGINLLYPLNYSIHNKDTVELMVQNNDLFAKDKEYIFEIDNNIQFNSSSSFYQNSGIIKANDVAKWKIKLKDVDSVVYFWRAKLVSNNPLIDTWIDASFTKINNSAFGFMQINFDQFNTSQTDKIVFDSINRQLTFIDNELVLGIQNRRFNHSNMGVIIPYQLNEGVGSCTGNTVVALVFEPFQVDFPYEIPGYPFNCTFVQNNKQNRSRRYYPFETTTQVGRDEFRRFIDSIPNGYYVAMFSRYGSEIHNWDATTLNSLSTFGLSKINQIKSKNSAWAFISKKGAENGFAIEDSVNNDSLAALIDLGMPNLEDNKILVINKALITKWYKGSITSKAFGPANNWSQLNFDIKESEVSTNSKFNIEVIGVKTSGEDSLIFENITNSGYDLSTINANRFPYLKLQINMEDSSKRTPQQFGFWQIIASPIAEAKLAPNFAFSIINNPIDEGDSLQIELGIENISSVLYDSSNLNLKILDDARIMKYESNITLKPLKAFSNLKVQTKLPTMGLKDNNQLQFSLNNNHKINELTYINNFISNNFIVKNDKSNPYIDVTFDGIKIMNGDIVSATPLINITSADNNKYILQKDTSLFNVMIRKPNNFEFERINLNTNEIEFISASNSNNKASILYKPTQLEDGKYAIKIQATDAVGNKAGNNEYEIEFTIINKSSISNFFPYPNPGTTNIRFVFTLTGSKTPDDLLIRISTISGKVVKEITKQEFGNIKFGNNISDYAWDGNDMYGDRLANGVYLYQVFTQINQKNIENIKSLNIDKFFNEGVGKIYLMR